MTTLSRLRQILIHTFPNTEIPENIENLKMGDFEEWDSIGNFNLILAIEDAYNIRFSMNEISQVKTIQELKDITDK